MFNLRKGRLIKAWGWFLGLAVLVQAGNIFSQENPAASSSDKSVSPASDVWATPAKAKKKNVRRKTSSKPKTSPKSKRAKPRSSAPSETDSAAASAVSDSSQKDSLLARANNAYAQKNYMDALLDYERYVKKYGETPEVAKKLLLAKYYAGQGLVQESREGIRQNERTIAPDKEIHNIMVYGKLRPSREAHPFTLSLSLLTPSLLGVDAGYTIGAHWNVGCGWGLLGWNPRLKYYVSGDVSSFFLGIGYATTNFSLSATADGKASILGQEVDLDGNASASIAGNFTYLSFGPAFQAENGCLMEFELEAGWAHFDASAQGEGGGSGASGSGSWGGTYDGPFGMLGFRWGWAF